MSRSQQEYNWDYYQTLDEIYAWLDKLAEDHPDVVSTFEIGTTVENRVIKGIKIDYKKRERPTIGLLKGALHAREWITPATVTWIVNQFLTSEDTNVRNLAENVVWHVIPVANPDGYVYSFTHVSTSLSNLLLDEELLYKTRKIFTYRIECGGRTEIEQILHPAHIWVSMMI